MTKHVRLWGGVTVVVGEQTYTHFPTQKTALLLAYLAIFPQQAHHRESVAGLLWGEASPDVARHNLRQALSALRKLLGEGIVLSEGRNRVRLADDVTVDINEWERLWRQGSYEDAERQRGGVFLDGFWDDWVLAERERLEERIAQATAKVASGVPQKVLPTPLTRFFGRETERERLCALLETRQVRLLTITGPGGLGKTRLAREVAHQVVGFALVLFVPLAHLTESRRLLEVAAESVCRVRGISRRPSISPAEEITSLLESRPTLFVLDNYEHLDDRTTRLALRNLLERCPTLYLLITSRNALGLTGESEFPLEPLPIPDYPGARRHLMEFPSVQLLVDRAQSVRADFQITEQNATIIAEMCSVLEGIPLAIELAARRLRVLTPQQVLEQLAHRFEVLRSNDTTIPERHRTLWNAIEGTVLLLPSAVQEVFRRLAVFRGGWTLASGGVVGATVDVLEKLQQTGLIQIQEREGQAEMRFRLLETLREYAWATLSPSARQEAQYQHAQYFLEWVQARQEEMLGAQQSIVLSLIDAEYENLSAARAIFRERQDSMAQVHLASALAIYFIRRSLLAEGRAWLQEAWEAGKPCVSEASLLPHLARIGDALGALCATQGDYDAAESALRGSLAIRRTVGEDKAIARSLGNLGTLAIDRGEVDNAYPLLQESLLLLKNTKSPPQVIAIVLCNLGIAAYYQEKWDESRVYLEESLTLRRSLEDTEGMGVVLLNFGSLALRQQQIEVATMQYRESLRYILQSGSQQHLLSAAEGAAQALLLGGHPERAVRWFGAIATQRQEWGAVTKPLNRQEQAHYENHALLLLGMERYQALWSTGQTESLQKHVEDFLENERLLTIF